MSKYLLILLIVVLLYALTRSGRKPPSQGATAPRRLRKPQAMVACARCGLHLPQADALAQDGQFYCCSAHRDQGPA
ncbi:PP0621 family protein [Comamonas flocculans]|uniref:Preprotein translocase subunit YajC n=1 Tax=Comamonas flocculans TaxID=2597701 RepID=A0A5B8RXS0_9BURK|nr:PP0621 family protein [Comamonas flocculans]QEA13438.1 hypothetical protein FOZ74_10580 [Comamonas flocculans]